MSAVVNLPGCNRPPGPLAYLYADEYEPIPYELTDAGLATTSAEN